MTPERWRQVTEVFHAALALDAPAREAYLDRASAGDPGLREEVDAMLAAHHSPAGFGDRPVRGAIDGARRLDTGAVVGAYRIDWLIGAGGMAEVYRARDTRLGRDVAIKVLPKAFTADPERVARLEREARMLAALNHPHIAHIYDVEKALGTYALVMELVDGPTLADRIAHGPIPVDEALAIVKQIAEALEAAHEQGIIHRDLKPANVKVRPDGTVKVLDFGLAKALEPASAAGVDATASPMTSPAMLTGVGVLLGTAAYMAPEQAKGNQADKRSDIWALGCLLYEMLSGTRAFAGDDAADTFAVVLTKEPDWTTLPASTPANIKKLLRRCLEKDRKRRLADIADARFEIDEGVTAPAAEPSSALPSTTVTREQRTWLAVTLAAVAAIALALGGATTWLAMRQTLQAPFVTRLTISPPGATGLSINGIDRDLAITPDGSRVVYVGAKGTQLFVRALDALESVAIFTGAPREPFVSPDGQWVGVIENGLLKKVAITGGPAVTLASIDSIARGATWAQDDAIIFATSNATTGLQRVPAAGGSPSVLTRPDRTRGEQDHLWPELLPDGRAVLFTITAQTGGLDAAQIGLLDLRTGMRRVLVRGGSHAHYVPDGRLVYAAAGALRAIAFDLELLEVSGTPVLAVPEVAMTTQGAVNAVVAANGTLAYISGGGAFTRMRKLLVWVNRQGQETAIPAPPRMYLYPRLAPDNANIVVYALDQENDIWLWSSARTTLTRMTFDPGIDSYPVLTPDGRRLIFSSERTGTRNLFWQAVDGTGTVERLTKSPNVQNAMSVSPDTARLIFLETSPKTGEDIMQLSLDDTRRVTPLIQTPFNERNALVSPDGRWLAYEANNSGQYEIYVRPSPDVSGGLWQVSTGGGTRPQWSRSGQELFYVAPSGALMRVVVQRDQSWAAAPPTMVLKEGYVTGGGATPGRTYDVSADGQRFLVIKSSGAASELTTVPPQLVVVQHFDEELRRLIPTN